MAPKVKKKQKFEAKEESIDRISSLPDFILTDILSHLPLHSAVATSVLSQRWRYLWTHLTYISFDIYSTKYKTWEDYFAVINRLLPQFTSPKIHSMALSAPYKFRRNKNDNNLQVYTSHLETVIAAACDRRVETIDVHVGGCCLSNESSIPAPRCMFRCQSLTSLSLFGVLRYNDDLLVVSLPNLKELKINCSAFGFELLEKLSKSCPPLEYLFLLVDMWDLGHSLDLSNLCLKRLFIRTFRDQSTAGGKLVINVSKLEDITLDGLCLGKLCFVKPLGALVTADMTLKPGFKNAMDYHSNIVEFAKLISSASSLRLNSTILKAVSKLDDRLLPLFDNLSNLHIEVDDINGSWNDLLVLLRCSPNIEILTLTLLCDKKQVLKWVVPDYPTPCGLTNIQRISIERLKGNSDDYMMMKYILSNANALKLLDVHSFFIRDSIAEYEKLQTELSELQAKYKHKMNFFPPNDKL